MERPRVPEYFKKKVLILGDGAVGKTSLIRRYVVDKFSDEYITTIGTKTTKRDIALNFDGREWNVSLLIWDVLGQKGYTEVQTSAFQGAKGVILVYDVSRPETRGSLVDYWIPRVWKVVGRLPMAVFANKADLAADLAAEEAQLHSMCELYLCQGYVTSAKTGHNVEDAFLALARELVRSGEAGARQMKDVLVAGEPEDNGIVAVADRIMMDFCREFGDLETAMPIVKQQFTKAGVDVKAPSRDDLLKVVNLLAEVEEGFKPAERVSENRIRRVAWVRKAN
jgi:small GTP-binding protein